MDLDKKVKYIVDIGVVRTAPPILRFLFDLRILLSGSYFSLFISAILTIVERLTGRLGTEYERTIVIYKKDSFWSKKELIYEELVPDGVQEQELSKRLYYLERDVEKGVIESTLTQLLKGEKRVFEGES